MHDDENPSSTSKPRLLRVSNGSPLEILLSSAGLTIGRDAGNALRIEDPVVSARHCTISLERGERSSGTATRF
jgi:pSer/pThr/pTyr-binding forkhead associated (FHA) protein